MRTTRQTHRFVRVPSILRDRFLGSVVPGSWATRGGPDKGARGPSFFPRVSGSGSGFGELFLLPLRRVRTRRKLKPPNEDGKPRLVGLEEDLREFMGVEVEEPTKIKVETGHAADTVRVLVLTPSPISQSLGSPEVPSSVLDHQFLSVPEVLDGRNRYPQPLTTTKGNPMVPETSLLDGFRPTPAVSVSDGKGWTRVQSSGSRSVPDPPTRVM